MTQVGDRSWFPGIVAAALIAVVGCSSASPTGPLDAAEEATLSGPTPLAGPALVIDSFEMLEVQYTSGTPWDWAYAPRIHVTSSSDRPITVTQILLQIGPDALRFSVGCPTAKSVVPRSGRDLFGYDGYGDFEFSMDKPDVRTPPGTPAYVKVIYFVGDVAPPEVATAETLITPGVLPAYGVATLSEPCQYGR